MQVIHQFKEPAFTHIVDDRADVHIGSRDGRFYLGYFSNGRSGGVAEDWGTSEGWVIAVTGIANVPGYRMSFGRETPRRSSLESWLRSWPPPGPCDRHVPRPPTRRIPSCGSRGHAHYCLENTLDLHSHELSVGDLIDLLSTYGRDARVRLAVNPFFPMAHRLGGVQKAVDEHGRAVVYIAESKEAEQFGPLSPAVAVALAWQPSAEGPSRRRRGASGPYDGQ